MNDEVPEVNLKKVVKRLKKSYDPSGENNPIPVGSSVDDVAVTLRNELLEAGVVADPDKVRKKAQEIVDEAPY